MNFTRLNPAPYKGNSFRERLNCLDRAISQCQKCPEICAARGRPVPGEYAKTMGLVLVGEAPGHDEDITGIPFVGAAGKFLMTSLRKLAVLRQDVSILNCLKCRPDAPSGNRKPSKVELDDCLPYLYAQLTILQPKLILGLGQTAASALGHDAPISRIRGKFLRCDRYEWKTLITWHPSFLLQHGTQANHAEFEHDLARAVAYVQ